MNAQVDVNVGTLDRFCELWAQRSGVDGVGGGSPVRGRVGDVDRSSLRRGWSSQRGRDGEKAEEGDGEQECGGEHRRVLVEG